MCGIRISSPKQHEWMGYLLTSIFSLNLTCNTKLRYPTLLEGWDAIGAEMEILDA